SGPFYCSRLFLTISRYVSRHAGWNDRRVSRGDTVRPVLRVGGGGDFPEGKGKSAEETFRDLRNLRPRFRRSVRSRPRRVPSLRSDEREGKSDRNLTGNPERI